MADGGDRRARHAIRHWLREYRREFLVFAVVAWSGAFFYGGASWNQLSRYDAIFSFVEPGTPDHLTFRINRFLLPPDYLINTGDWAQNPRYSPAWYFSNKAPGPLLLGVVPYFGIYYAERALGWDPAEPQLTVINCYLLNLLLTALPLAVSSVFFFWLVLRLTGGDRGWATALTLALYLGTLLFPYSTQLWGHGTAAAFLVMAVYFLAQDRRRADILAGLTLGLAVLSEYSVGVTLVTFVAALLWRRRFAGLGFLALGGLLPLIAFVVYHRLCFGQFVTTATFHNNPGFLDPAAAAGLFRAGTWAEALWGLTFSPYRGLFWYCPVTLLAVAAAGVGLWRRRAHWLYWLALTNVLAFLALNVCFSGWHGGACMGPRYLIPVLPFYLLFGALLPGLVTDARWRRPLLVVAAAVAVLSGANMLVCAAVTPLARDYRSGIPAAWRNALPTYYVGLFRHGAVHPAPFGTDALRLEVATGRVPPPAVPTFNLGELIGLRGAWTLLPWLAVVAACGWGLGRDCRRPVDPRPAGGPPQSGGRVLC